MCPNYARICGIFDISYKETIVEWMVTESDFTVI